MTRPSTGDEQQLILCSEIIDTILMNYLQKDQDILNFILASKTYYDKFNKTRLLRNVLHGGCTALVGAAKTSNKALMEKMLEIPVIEKAAPREIWQRAVRGARNRIDLVQLLLQVDCVRASIDEEAHEMSRKERETWKKRNFYDSWLWVMWLAIADGQADVMELLLSHGLTVEACDEFGWTALHVAARGSEKAALGSEKAAGGSEKAALVIVRLLLEKYQADPNKAAMKPGPLGQRYTFPLYVAAEQGHAEIVQLLLEHNADPCAGDSGTFCHALALAVAGDHGDVVKILSRDEGVDLDAHDADGIPILALAIKSGNTDLVQTLLENERINPNATTADGRSPLMMAAKGVGFRCETSGLAMTKLLLADKRVDVFLKDNRGWNAMFHAASNGQHEVLEMYLNDGRLDPNEVSWNLDTPVSLAEDGKCLELLNDTRVDLNKVNREAMTPLMNNVSLLRPDNVERLVNSGRVDVNQTNHDGNTAMMMAILSYDRHYESSGSIRRRMVQCMLESGKVNLDLVNNNGETALMMAVKSEMEDAVKRILAMGHRMTNIKDVDGLTMIEYAIQNDSMEIIQLLLETDEVKVTQKIVKSPRLKTIQDMLVRYKDKMEQFGRCCLGSR